MNAAFSWLIGVLALSILSVTACGSNHQAGTGGVVPSTNLPPASLSPSTSTTSPSIATCSLADLRIIVMPPVGSAGALHYEFTFENVSATTCSLYGFSGVSFQNSEGDQIGPPAERGTVAPQFVTLAQGAKGYATLDVTDPGIPPCTGPGTVTEIKVYPPASYRAAYVAPPTGMQVCASPSTPNYVDTTIGPVTATPGPGF